MDEKFYYLFYDLNQTVKNILVNSQLPIIIVFCDYEYREVALNWYKAIHRLGIKNYLIIALDNKLFSYLVEQHINCIEISIEDFNLFSLNLDLTVRSEYLKLLWIFRMYVFENLISNDISFIHSDADCIWMNDFQKKWILNYQHLSFIFSQGTIYPYDVCEKWKLVLCCGLFYAKSNQINKKIMKSLLEFVLTFNDDQVAVNKYFCDILKINWDINNNGKSHRPQFLTLQMNNRNYPIIFESTLITGQGVFENNVNEEDIHKLIKSGLITGINETNDIHLNDIKASISHMIYIGLLPLDKFQRLYMPEINNVQSLHILSEKKSDDKLAIFKETNSFFL